jgi:hypothetical protein
MFTRVTLQSLGIPKSEPIAKSFPAVLRVLLVPTFILLAIYCFHFSFYRTYFPYGDDPALLHASGGNATKWVTEGYSKYFVVYPEWNVARTDFLRPQVNLIVRLNETFFGNHYFLYFASFYLAQSLICNDPQGTCTIQPYERTLSSGEKEGDPTGRWRLPAKCDRMG